MGRLSATLVAGLLIALMLPGVASAATTTGTWTQYPNGATEYQAQVQQPINSANTSNWNSKSKGAIPVMFKLSSRTGPAAFESIYSDNTTINDGGGTCGTGSGADHNNDCAFMSFTPNPGLTFNDITTLRTTYAFTQGNCYGGSLRWSVRVSPTQSVFIYYGDYPNFTDCTTNSQSGTNMIGLSDLRYDTTQVGGTFYDSYANAQALVGSMNVMRVSLVLDGGWGGDQRLTVSNTSVNDNVYQWNAGGTGDFAATCDLPAATIEVTKLTPNAVGAINEEPVQASLADDGNAFRVVDCKYQYILSIPSLPAPRSGNYRIEILIGGNSVPTPGSTGGQVRFDIR